MTHTITRRDLPNVWSHTFKPNNGGNAITLYRPVPGDVSPSFSIGTMSTKVTKPERFGPYGTRKEFEQWCHNFVHNREVKAA